MSEAITPPAETPATPPPAEGTPPPSGLPSEQPADNIYDGFNLSDDVKSKFKDGKLNGRFGSLDDVLVKLKEAEDFKSATISEQKKAEGNNQVHQELVATQQSVVDSLVPEFMNNGMVLTPEMEAKAVEAKIDIRDIKIGAMELREAANVAYKTAGGKERYDSAHAWARENLDDRQKAMFTKDVDSPVSGVSEIAVEWLMSKYDKALAEGTTSLRIQGQPHNTGARPYADRRELYKDKDYVESPAGRRDTAAVKMYNLRKKMTSDAVLFGR